MDMILAQREKYTENWRKNYKYEVVSRLKLNVKTPTPFEKTEMIKSPHERLNIFLNNSYSEEKFQGIHKQLCFKIEKKNKLKVVYYKK